MFVVHTEVVDSASVVILICQTCFRGPVVSFGFLPCEIIPVG